MKLSESRRRERGIVLAREVGLTWKAIGDRHGISPQYAQQIYRAATWPTEVAERSRNPWVTPA